ncbi:MAG TPA: hypothetical protein VF783_02895, partial [Terriglobales bacterium]
DFINRPSFKIETTPIKRRTHLRLAAEPKRWMSVTAPVSALIGQREGQTDPFGRAGHDGHFPC